MKKYLLIFVLLFVSFHDTIELNGLLDSRVNLNSLTSQHFHIDDMFGVVSEDSKPENPFSLFIAEAMVVFYQESFCKIWKPPVIV